jgi:hypothetical protein
MRNARHLLPLTLALAPCLALAAQDPKPEIARQASTPQANGQVHTLRTIPEACARIEGQFTGHAADPYKFTLARTSPNCQPRARLVDAKKVKPSTQDGWLFNDRIVVPSAACATQSAVVRVWRKPAAAAPPDLDAQGRSRIYLKEATDAAKGGKGASAVPMFAVAMDVEGTPCAK